MGRKQELEFANFICKFGENINLMDVFDAVILPAFQSGAVRERGRRSWIIRGAEMVNFHDGESGLVFQFVKNTVLEREQVMVRDELVMDPKTLPSSPSAIGLLVLNSHRLVYYPETKFAPSFSELRTTCQRLIRSQQAKVIDAMVASDTSGAPKNELRARLHEGFPPCDLRIVPMGGEEDVAKIVDLYKVVRRVTIKLQATNNEIVWGPLFQGIEKSRKAMGAKTAKLEHSAPDGLNKTQTVREVSAASSTGNGAAYISGTGHNGNRIEHNPEGFKARASVNIPEGATPRHAAPIMKHTLDGLVEQGVLKPPAPEQPAPNRTDKK